MIITMRAGFSGTRNGMTRLQLRAVHWYLSALLCMYDSEDGVLEAHHGDCTGADAEFHVLATALGFRTVAHPPANPRLRAWCTADEVREPKDYLARDWDIAAETRELIAAPATPEYVAGSGTWATIGYAQQLGRTTGLALPDGTVRGGAFGLAPPVVPFCRTPRLG